MVTRPTAQAKQLVLAIEKLGGICTQFPLLEITPLADDHALRELISRLSEFYLAIFISPNAVKFGMEAIQKLGGLPDSLKIATIGPGSAQALQDDGVKKVLVPTLQFDSEGLLALAELQNVKNKKIAIFRGDSGRELLGDTLKLRGAQIEYATCYLRSQPALDVNVLLASRPDALSISSSEALNNLWDALQGDAKIQFTALPLFVSHPRIASAAQKQGWQHIITTENGDTGLLSALASWAELKNSKPRQ